MNCFTVIQSAVEESRDAIQEQFHGVSRLHFASLGVTANRTLAILFCLTFGIASVGFAQSDAEFAKANQGYAQGRFKEAIDGYESLVRSGQWSANVFYDLGNAYFRTNDFGRAILNYERSLALEQHHPEATANLQIATADTANSVLVLPPGSEVKIVSTRGDWIYAALPNNLRGWIPAKSTERVRLL